MNPDIGINFKSIGIILLIIYFLTVSIYHSIFGSLFIQILIIVSILLLLLFHYISTGEKLYLRYTDFLFFLSAIYILSTIYGGSLTTKDISDQLIISTVIIISILLKGPISNFRVAFNIIKYGGLFYALSIIYSYLFPELYIKTFLVYLHPLTAQNIIASMSEGYNTGFASNVAYTSGYIVMALGVIYCEHLVNAQKVKISTIIIVIILFLALLLTQKRAHLFFMGIASLLVYLQTSKYFINKVLRLLKFTFISFFIIIPIISIGIIFNIGNTFFLRIMNTFQGFLLGEDVTSRRSELWEHAWHLFLNNPLKGIGWGEFKETVIGSVTEHTEMETHNIYLQLLSETGLIGTSIILIPIILTYLYTTKVMRNISRNKNTISKKWIFTIYFSTFIQTFFLLYGITGNPFYDYNYLIMYFFSCSMIYSFWQEQKMLSIK